VNKLIKTNRLLWVFQLNIYGGNAPTPLGRGVTISVCMCVSIHTHICVCVCVRVCVYMHMCVCVCVCRPGKWVVRIRYGLSVCSVWVNFGSSTGSVRLKFGLFRMCYGNSVRVGYGFGPLWVV